MNRPCPSRSRAASQRLYRRRVVDGRFIVAAELDDEVVDKLISVGLLDARVADDRDTVRAAFQRQIELYKRFPD